MMSAAVAALWSRTHVRGRGGGAGRMRAAGRASAGGMTRGSHQQLLLQAAEGPHQLLRGWPDGRVAAPARLRKLPAGKIGDA